MRKASREMVSEANLAEEPVVWSVESRLVDSLSTISRDLGRELSLNEFLIKLAPEIGTLRYSPILPDARIFKRVLRSSHRPATVEFNRAQQQSAVKWVKRTPGEEGWSIDLFRLLQRDLFEKYVEATRERNVRDTVNSVSTVNEFQMEVCDFSGDDSAVDCVVTRVIPLVRSNSAVACLYQAIVSGIRKLLPQPESTEFLALMETGWAVCMAATGYRWKQHGMYRGDRNPYQLWRENRDVTLGAMKTLAIPCDLPEDLQAFSDSFARFNASSFWLDWWQGES